MGFEMAGSRGPEGVGEGVASVGEVSPTQTRIAPFSSAATRSASISSSFSRSRTHRRGKIGA